MKLGWQPQWIKEVAKDIQLAIQHQWEEIARVVNYNVDVRQKEFDLPVYANNAAAVAGGLAVGELYRTNGDPDTVCVVH